MRCVELVRVLSVAAIVIAGQSCAHAQMALEEPDALADAASLEIEDLATDDDMPGEFATGDLAAGGLAAALGVELAGGFGSHATFDFGTLASGPGPNPPPAGAASFAMLAPFPGVSPTLSGGGTADLVLLFGGYDVWRNGSTAYTGLHWAENGLDQDGFIIRLTMSKGVERYVTPRGTYVTDIFRAAVTPGWRAKLGELELKLFAGADFEDRALTPDNSLAKWRGPHPGLRIAGEAWAQPTPDLMLASSFYATTIAAGYGFYAAAGWRLIDAFWLGPEFSGARDETSRQTRIGLHLTGLRSGPVEWSAAMGYIRDSFGRDGNYARLAAQLRP